MGDIFPTNNKQFSKQVNMAILPKITYNFYYCLYLSSLKFIEESFMVIRGTLKFTFQISERREINTLIYFYVET